MLVHRNRSTIEIRVYYLRPFSLRLYQTQLWRSRAHELAVENHP